MNLRTFQENNPCNRKGPRNGQMGKERNFIAKQNTHDLLVGTLSIGIPSCSFLWIDADERDRYATCADRICYNIPTKESCLKLHSYRENRP